MLTYKNYVSALTLIILTLVLFVFLHPSISSLILPFKRNLLLTQFIARSKKANDIKPQEFWQFREFYDPGSIVFDKHRIPQTEITNFEKISSLKINSDVSKNTFFSFNSAKFHTIDSFIAEEKTDNARSLMRMVKGTPIIKRNDLLITKDENKYTIFFIKPLSELKKANAHYDFQNTDKDILKKPYYWFSMSVIYI